MEHDQPDMLELKSEIINTFRPIEQLFKIMDKSSSPELPGDIARSYAEVGLELCQNFRRKLDHILPTQGKESDDAR
ncbi:MAG: hypothetical protein ACP59X_18260 [Solidesulfovibrio sp. DCME]|uniref:hypothetical protein n=1 Tax=Solidesulfovibrio sp. DCME TaxID=3447380 RepID=UPI003D0F68C7